MKIMITLIYLFALISCGSDGAIFGKKTETIYTIKPAQAEDYTYEFSTNDCSTGRQSFPTFDLTCNGLSDEDLNNNCSTEAREILFISAECPGSFS